MMSQMSHLAIEQLVTGPGMIVKPHAQLLLTYTQKTKHDIDTQQLLRPV